MDIDKVRERCLNSPTRRDALDILEMTYIFGNITPTIYNKVKLEIHKQFNDEK